MSKKLWRGIKIKIGRARDVERKIAHGRWLAQLEIGQNIADILCFGATDGSATSVAYYDELMRLYRRVCNERWETSRSTIEINNETRAELQRVKGHVDKPARAVGGEVLFPNVSADNSDYNNRTPPRRTVELPHFTVTDRLLVWLSRVGPPTLGMLAILALLAVGDWLFEGQRPLCGWDGVFVDISWCPKTTATHPSR